ncbi:Tetratricopeptide repeat-containing protein [Micromonospora coriariae]|uniref:Tetratricopeptide repeat-containing protein n=1 Tax=Micromonospora coriariae TaxID=285665 RepID=A0A1C4UM20_9ACTN|nr:tetratricopeptide repeat protein [Micromonospora coriariae]SCE72671.1 Tetratricopeptide repeat-containing protein [Micromonospora coriariae]
MPSGFGELTDQAHHLVSAGDLAGAQRLLSDALTDADPRPANANPELAEAASLQARVLVALGEPHSARGWAAFAYAATTRLHGRSDPRTVAAAATLAAVLHRVGSHSRAARLYQEVILELTAQDGPESLRVLAAHADLATVEYARGQCTVARDRLQDAWELHREVYGDGHPSGIKMLARLGAMQRDCGQFAEAHDNLALARELCRQHLPADDPLAAQVAALARAAANPDHVCADETPRDSPVVPAARAPSQGNRPVEPGSQPPDPPHADPAPGPAIGDDEALAGHGGVTGGGAVPNPRSPADEPGGSVGFTWPADPADGPDRHLTDTPVPPSVVGLAGSAEEASGVYRLHRPGTPSEPYPPSEPYTPPGAYGPPDPYAPLEPYTPSRLLPVPVHRAPAPRRNRLVPVLVAGVVVVVLGTAAVIAGVARVGDRDDEPPGPGTASPSAGPTGTGAPASGGASPAGSAPPAAAPGTPPGTVTLRDNRDSIALRWTYPAGGEGPVVVSAGRAGQGKNAIATLPAGATSFVVYALNRANDYCFTVAVVWSTDTVASADEVCTRRH